MTTTDIPRQACPCCQTPVGETRGASVWPPVEGDIGRCAHCGEVLRFGAGLALRVLTRREFLALPDHARDRIARSRDLGGR